MEYYKAKRRKRLRNTYLVARRRLQILVGRFTPSFRPESKPLKERNPSLSAPFYYAKQSIGCRCSKKTHGRPKLARGGCGGYQRSTVYSRRSARLVERALANGYMDPEDVLPPWGWHGDLSGK